MFTSKPNINIKWFLRLALSGSILLKQRNHECHHKHLWHSYKNKVYRDNEILFVMHQYQIIKFWTPTIGNIWYIKYITRHMCRQQPLARFTAFHSKFCLTLVSFFSEISKGTFWGWKYLHFSRNNRKHLKPSLPVVAMATLN